MFVIVCRSEIKTKNTIDHYISDDRRDFIIINFVMNHYMNESYLREHKVVDTQINEIFSSLFNIIK